MEETLAHQQQEIDALNRMVTRQRDEIDLLKKQVRKLQGAVSEVTENQTASAAEQAARDKPPHY
ncbi:MAG TPA: SlyX family protein [Patescibacteria group bacterium]|nr:SlyX family protein [Patescibacteria group bacterium]